MPLRRTAPPDPLVVERLAHLLPDSSATAVGGWVPEGLGAVSEPAPAAPTAGNQPDADLADPVELDAAPVDAPAAARFTDAGGPADPQPAEAPSSRPRHAHAAGSAGAAATPSVLDLWRVGRVSPGLRGALALGLVAVLATALTAVFVVRGRPQEVAAPPPVVQAGVPVPGSAAEQTAGPEVVVAVGGRVRRPGLVRLPAGSRVDDALRAVGGAVRPRDVALVNLARQLVDGEQLLVGVDPPDAPSAPAAGGGPPGGPLDLNAATLEQLDALPGIGPVLAQRILDWRTEHGRFGSVDQLREVSGIGEATYADLAGQVRV